MKATEIIVLAIILIAVIAGAWLIFNKPEPAAINVADTNSSSYDVQGMKIEILQEGTGDSTKIGDTVMVNYTGALLDGTKFDSSVDPSFGHVEPFPFTLGQNRVIKGWELGVLGMKVGERRRLTIPPELAYGERGGGGGVIPPNATLIFEIDLLGIK